MAFRGDPYRVLGLPPGATMAEVKRAYRLLAKRNHPDAGAGSVARFIEIQAAYEVLARTDEAGAARVGSNRTSGRRPAQPGPRGTGARPAGGESPAGGEAPPAGTEWARRPREDPGRPSAGSGHAGDRGRRGRDRRKATLGSTTYDDPGEAAEPTWDGAAWYGPASGTYWTLNPKEYADPRKHGPDYLARWSAARARSLHDRPGDQPPDPWQQPGGAPAAEPEEVSTPGARRRQEAAPPDMRAESGEASTPGARPRPTATPPDMPPTAAPASAATAGARRDAGAETPSDPTAAPRPARPEAGATAKPATAAEAHSTARHADAPAGPSMPRPSPGDTARTRVAASPPPAASRNAEHPAWPRPAERLIVGAVGWLPFGLLLAAAVGLPGGVVATLPLQAVGLFVMARAPRLAWASAGGLVAAIAFAIPGVAALAALGVAVRPGGPAPIALVVLATLAWCGGAALAASGRLVGRPWRARP